MGCAAPGRAFSAQQERVYREVAAVFAGGRETAGQSPPADSRFASVDKLNELKFVEQCVKETLRIFTLFPLTIRKTTEQIKLDGKCLHAPCPALPSLAHPLAQRLAIEKKQNIS